MKVQRAIAEQLPGTFESTLNRYLDDGWLVVHLVSNSHAGFCAVVEKEHDGNDPNQMQLFETFERKKSVTLGSMFKLNPKLVEDLPVKIEKMVTSLQKVMRDPRILHAAKKAGCSDCGHGHVYAFPGQSLRDCGGSLGCPQCQEDGRQLTTWLLSEAGQAKVVELLNSTTVHWSHEFEMDQNVCDLCGVLKQDVRISDPCEGPGQLLKEQSP